jgi:glycosyl transferase family 87
MTAIRVDERHYCAKLALGLALLGALSMLYYQFGVFMPRVESVRAAKHLQGEYSFGNDFYPVWLTTREWLRERRDPYGPELTRDIQMGLFGRPLDGQFSTDPPSDYRTYAYPAFTNLLLWPLSEAPFRTLRIVWAAFLAVLLAAAVLFWTRALSWQVSESWLAVIILLTVSSYPELEGLYAGQLGLLVGFLLAASLLALVRGRLLAAGILLALTTIKPQMTLLAIVYLLLWSAQDWSHRRRFSLAFIGTSFLLIAASLAVWPGWIESWSRVVAGYPRYSMPPLASELLGSVLGPHGGVGAIAILLIAALVVGWRGRAAPAGSHKFWLTLSLVLAITAVALLPGQSVCDHVILLPGIFVLACRRELHFSTRMSRALLAIGIAVLLWPYTAAFSLVVLRPLLNPELFASKAVFVLPLRTAAAFPFVVLGLLATARPAISGRGRELVSASRTLE